MSASAAGLGSSVPSDENRARSDAREAVGALFLIAAGVKPPQRSRCCDRRAAYPLLDAAA